MPNTYEGKALAAHGKLAIVVSRFNDTITSRLLEGALAVFREAGVGDADIDVVWVPGAFEIPTVAARLADTDRYLAIVCLGCVIRGETTHDEHINRAVSLAIAELGIHHAMPVIFGLLTCNTLEQAVARSGGEAGTRGKDRPDSRKGNKGAEAAQAALEMIDLMRQLPE